MKQTMVRYKVKPEAAAQNESLIRAVFAALARERPAGLRYASYKLGDGVSFVHIASHDSADGRNPLTELAVFKEFAAGIGERCVEPPLAVDYQEVGSYDGFGK